MSSSVQRELSNCLSGTVMLWVGTAMTTDLQAFEK